MQVMSHIQPSECSCHLCRQKKLIQNRVDRPYKNKIKSIRNPTSINLKNNILTTLLEITVIISQNKKIKIKTRMFG